MRHIHINSGRLLQRHVGEGDYILGIIHLDPNEKILEGVDYLLMLDNQQSFLLELPAENQKSLSPELQNASLDDILCSQTWRKTTEQNIRIVRLIKQFDDSNGWLVFGPKIDKNASADKWFDVVHSYVFPIPEPIPTRGEKATQLAREPIWPHPNGQCYTMVPNFPALRKALAQSSEFKALAHTHAGFSKILNFNSGYTKAFFAHPFWSEHMATSLNDGYKEYLHTLHSMGMVGEEKPLSSTEHAAREQVLHDAVKPIAEQWRACEIFQEAVPLSIQQRDRILASSTDPIECANAVFEAVLDNDQTVSDRNAWQHMSIDHVILCALPAIANNNVSVVEKIAHTITQSNCSEKDNFMLRLAQTATRLEKSKMNVGILKDYVPKALTQDWECVAYDIIPINPKGLRHWVGIYDKPMFENVLGYTLNNREKGGMSWEEKCEFMKETVEQSSYTWDQNTIFWRASYAFPLPTIQQWDALFSALNVKPVPQKGLYDDSVESFNRYFDWVCALEQKQVLENAIEPHPQSVAKKKM